MDSLVLALISFAALAAGYFLYGRFLARKVFSLSDSAPTPTPAHRMRDEIDYVPAPKGVLFGHHFTSIAGLGPILGPAIGIIWGWVPAVLWVVLGAIVLGAVHDLSALVLSVRNRAQSVGEVAKGLISPRVRTLFLLIIFFALWLVIALFALIIAKLFHMYPEAVFPVWMEIPIAVALGWAVYRKGANAFLAGLVAVTAMYVTVVIGAWLPLSLPWRPIITWMVILFGYCFVASVLPVQVLLRPRDYINAFQLAVAGVLLVAGILVARPRVIAPAVRISPGGVPQDASYTESTAGWADSDGDRIPDWWESEHKLDKKDGSDARADPDEDGLTNLEEFRARTDPVRADTDGDGLKDAEDGQPLSSPPLWPLLFVTIACGAISGFHSLVSSGTSSKQLDRETDALPIGYGGMLLEGGLAVLAIVAVAAGVGMGLEKGGEVLSGQAAWAEHYSSWQAAKGLGSKIHAFVSGSANILGALGIPWTVSMTIMGVFLVSFAATTLDTATRIQRYVVTELARDYSIPVLTNRYAATALAVGLAAVLAFLKSGGGGALILWPLFGSVNQLLAGLVLLVATLYLFSKGKYALVTFIPMLFMVVMTGWAMVLNLKGFFGKGDWLLLAIGGAIFLLELWMIAEAGAAFVRALRARRARRAAE